MKLREPKELSVISHVDMDWGADRNDRKSISSLITTLGGTCLLNFQSKKQNTVALSSTEAELYAETSAVQDMLYVGNLLEEITQQEPQRGELYADNMGAIFLAKNLSLGQRTKHVDIRTRFVADVIDDEKLMIYHQSSEDNPADIGSKNCREELHKRHAENMYEGHLEPANREGVRM